MPGVLIGTINLYLIRKVQDVSSSGTTCEGPLMRVRLYRSTCGGPLMRVRLWRSTFLVNPFTRPKRTPSSCPSEPLYPAQVNPYTQPKRTPSSSQSEPLHPAKVQSLLSYYTQCKWVLRIMLHAVTAISLYTQCMGFSQKVGILLSLEQIYFYPITVNTRSILTE